MFQVHFFFFLVISAWREHSTQLHIDPVCALVLGPAMGSKFYVLKDIPLLCLRANLMELKFRRIGTGDSPLLFRARLDSIHIGQMAKFGTFDF